MSTASTSGTYYIDVGAYNDGYTGDYQLSVAVPEPLEVATYDEIADQLVNGYWGGDWHARNVGTDGSISVNITALTAEGQALARAALASWSDIIGVDFVEVTTGGEITFDDAENGAYAQTNWSNHVMTSAFINVGLDWLGHSGTTLDSYSYQTYLHEIGHALGLGHAGNYNGSASYPNDALFANDAWSTSLLSYFSPTENDYFADQGFTYKFR